MPNDNMKTENSPDWRDVNVEVLTPSSWSAAGFVQAGVARDSIHVCPHGVDPDIFKPASDPEQRLQLRHKLGWDSEEDGGTFVFLSVCSSRMEEKGVPDLLTAFHAISKEHPQARLVLKCLAGKGVEAVKRKADAALLDSGRIR